MEISAFLVVFLSQDSDTARTSGLAECAKALLNKFRKEASNVNMHETKAITVTEAIIKERLGNGSGARHGRAWIHLYITRGTEEE
jgi:hypothetical protein